MCVWRLSGIEDEGPRTASWVRQNRMVGNVSIKAIITLRVLREIGKEKPSVARSLCGSSGKMDGSWLGEYLSVRKN